MFIMSLNSIPVDPAKRSDFYSDFPDNEWDASRIRTQSLASFHKMFQDELANKQRENEEESDVERRNSLKKFYDEHVDLLTDGSEISKTLSQYEYSYLNLIQFIKRNRRKFEISNSLPVSYLSRQNTEWATYHAENYVLNQNYFRNPIGEVYSGEL